MEGLATLLLIGIYIAFLRVGISAGRQAWRDGQHGKASFLFAANGAVLGLPLVAMTIAGFEAILGALIGAMVIGGFVLLLYKLGS